MRRLFSKRLVVESTPTLSGAVAAVAAGAILWAPSLTQACAVCTAGRDDENAFAFLLSTLFMSAMPLLALGTVLFVLWRRVQKLDAEREAAHPVRPVRIDAPPRPSA